MERSYKDIAVQKCGFYLPECAYFDTINDAPDDAKKAVLVKKAMEAIECENACMEDVLPKEVYGQLVPEEEPELLSRIVRVFKDIPENISIDIFGQIYEYFLGNFALAEGQGGGAFYTPPSVVQYMVDFVLLRAIRNFSILLVVRAVCLCKLLDTCIVTMLTTRIL